MELLVDPVSRQRIGMLYCETLERQNETNQDEASGNLVGGRGAGSEDEVNPAEICPRL